MGLSAREVQERSFSTARRGYDRDEVDGYLDDLAQHLSVLEEQMAIASAKAERAQRELDRINDVLDTRLTETHEARRTILDEARREAAVIVSTANELEGSSADTDAINAAAAIVAEAEARAEIRLGEVEAIIEQARQEALQSQRDTAQTAELRLAEADRVIEDARKDAREIRRIAEADRSEMEDQLAHLRRIVVAAGATDGRNLSAANIELRDNGDIVVDLTASATVREDTSA
jgi:DivIVA domain-containing protein